MKIVFYTEDFDAEQTFECGQCFRWNRGDDGSYSGVVTLPDGSGAYARVSAEPCDGAAVRVTVESTYEGPEAESFWYSYLDLGRDYGAIKKKLAAGDEKMQAAIACGGGIRLLSQDPYETLVSFIISQNNNIPRIKKCIEGLAELCGDSLGVHDGKERFAFPRPERMAALTAEDLAPLRTGYRAPYITGAAQSALDDGERTLYKLADMSFADAYAYLTSLTGVGPKVASCILLFGCGHREAFPVDVWVRRAMSTLYGLDENDKKGMAAYAAEHFGDLGGYAQQYIFYYLRSGAAAE